MTARPNEQIVLLALGVLQPASAIEVKGYLAQMFRAAGIIPDAETFESFFIEQEKLGRILTVSSGENRRFSLTYRGTEFLDPGTRRVRDKLRLFLLREAHKRRFLVSRAEVAKELAGVSPALDNRTTVKGREANDLGLRYSLGQARWPRISRQFQKTGSSPSARDALQKLISFGEPWQLRIACEMPQIGLLPDTFDWNFRTLGVAFGISPGLITQIARNRARHYRTFEIRKRDGSMRVIESPRVFLKVIQWLLNNFVFLPRLKVSEANHAFRSGRTVLSNARQHLGTKFVGNVDISKFFNSVSEDQIAHLLRDSGFTPSEAQLLSILCTKDGHLPQGAPTSPILSNALLHELDETFLRIASQSGCTYTRYADDITMSGPTRIAVNRLMSEVEGFLLGRYNLTLNAGKTRIASSNGRQIVTGVVVNQIAQPARDYRKRIRAIFHHAKQEPKKYAKRVAELYGYIGYLSQFPTPTIARSVAIYRETIDLVRSNAPMSSRRK